MEFNSLCSVNMIDWSTLDEEVKQDVVLKNIRQKLQEEEVTKGFTMEGGRLCCRGRLVLPNSSLISGILKEFHDSPIGGHIGKQTTYARIASDWFWERMKKRIVEYVKNCEVCQRQKHSSLSPAGLLQPLLIPDQIWEHISMDFIEGLPKSEGKDSILVVVDRLTKYAHFIALKHPFTIVTVAESFVKEIVCLHGFPTSIVSDHDKIFMSHLWRELFRLHNIALKRSTTYHPQTYGQTEVVNKTL